MTTTLDQLVETAIDLGVRSSIAGLKTASQLANAKGSDPAPQAAEAARASEQLRAAYKASLQAISNAAPEQLASLRTLIVGNVRQTLKKTPGMRQWVCKVCDFVYDERVGMPEGGIAPGTPFEDFPDGWICPDCGVGKSMFSLVEG